MMREVDKRDRLTGAAAILVIPLAAMLVALLIRVDTFGGFRTVRPAALDFNLDVQAAVRWVVAAGLLLATAVIARAVLRTRGSRRSTA
jgi:hypothetical protein